MAYGIDAGELHSPADNYGKGSKLYTNIRRILKIVAYGLFFVLVLCTAVASKGSLLLMTQSLGNAKQEREYAGRWSILLTAMLCIPYVFTFMESIAHSLFRNRKGPTFGDILVIFLIEGLHSFGLCLLIFRVLPSCDVIRALLLMNCVCIVPGFLKIIFSKNSAGPFGKVLILFIDLIAFAAQITVFFVAMNTEYTAFIQKSQYTSTIKPMGGEVEEQYDPFSMTESKNTFADMTASQQPIGEKPKWRGNASWELPIALILTSIGWWENYVDRDIKFGFIRFSFAKYKRHLQSVRSKANIGASLWKILLTIMFSIVLLPSKKFENTFVKFPSNADGLTTGIPSNIDIFENNQNLFDDFNGGGAATVAMHMMVRRDDAADDSATESIVTSTVIMTTASGDLLNTVPNNVVTPVAPNMFDFVASKEKTADDYWKSIVPFIPFIIHFLSTWFCYYFAKSACKMCMQRIAFAMPMTLATPTAIGIYLAICYGKIDRIDFIKDMMYWECSESFTDGSLKWQLIVGLGLWWLSEIWICIHIWFPENKRLASTELALIEQSLIMNRRRNEKEYLERELKEHFEELDMIDNGEFEFGQNEKRLNVVPKIYLCGTLWHETRGEMIQILKSIMRMDIDQSARKKAKEYLNIHDPDYYEVEGHIFFDDAFEKNDKGEKTVNQFVTDLMSAMDRAASIVHEIDGMKMTPPMKTPTPYGGRLTWKLPGGNLLVVHLKDKKKVLRKKRWSMVMYMYYLLGYRLLGQCEDRLFALYKKIEEDPMRKRYKKHIGENEELHIYYKDVLGPKLLIEAENTFLLSIDGDVDFRPDSVRMLIDRLKKNTKVACVSGRVHPIGTGPLIWFQKMEYALSYWLQKTTEHSLGCVLCAPGCFSLYRGSSLMDDNVMRMFAKKCEEPKDHLLYDLGEDRWLSRLLIEQGYKIEYCAASDAYTHAPETFTEYFNQRRRWIPSTLGNTVTILKNYRRTIRVNENVSFMCILYHICFLASYILSPATITIAIADAFNATTDIDIWGSFILACLPVVVFLIVCYQNCKEEIKIGFAAILGTYYSILMMIVVVGTIVRVVDGSWKTTSVLFLVIMAVIFFLTAFCHPFELYCVKPCFLFFLCIPTSYILVVIYSLTTMNQTNWGTRDNVYMPNKKRKVNLDENDIKELEKQLHEAKLNNELINKIEDLLENNGTGGNSNDELLLQVLAALERIEMKETIEKQLEKGVDVEKFIDAQLNKNQEFIKAQEAPRLIRDDMVNPYWIEDEPLKFCELRYLNDKEINFWKKCIKKYLQVERVEIAQQHKLQLGLDDMRDRGVFAFFMLNSLWIAFVFPILLAQDRLKDMLYIPIPIPSLYYQPVLIEPLGVLHLAFFACISLIQFVSMLCHRYNTFQHIVASTKLKSNVHEGMRIEEIIDTVKMLQQIKPIDEDAEPMPDYSDEEIDKTSDDISEFDDVVIKAKSKLNEKSGLRNRLNNSQGHDNPAFIDDTAFRTTPTKKPNTRSRSEDPTNKKKQIPEKSIEEIHVLNKANRRSRRLQKKNSLDVQFRRRFSMLRGGGGTDAAAAAGGDSKRTDVKNKISMASMMDSANPTYDSNTENIPSAKNIIDKRFNKMLFNMHGIPIQPNVTSQQVEKMQKEKKMAPLAPRTHQKPRISSKQRSIVQHHV